MQRLETQFSTREQVKTYLESALEIVSELEIPDEWREAAFLKTVDMLAHKTVAFVNPEPVGMPLMALPRNARH